MLKELRLQLQEHRSLIGLLAIVALTGAGLCHVTQAQAERVSPGTTGGFGPTGGMLKQVRQQDFVWCTDSELASELRGRLGRGWRVTPGGVTVVQYSNGARFLVIMERVAEVRR
jgi:hypothetical protein